MRRALGHWPPGSGRRRRHAGAGGAGGSGDMWPDPTFQWVGLWAHGLVGVVHPIDDRTDHWKLKLNFVVEDHGRPR